MAKNPVAAELTEAHRLAQARIGQRVTSTGIMLWSTLIDPTSLAATAVPWMQAVVGMVRAAKSDSAKLGAAYYNQFRALELGGQVPAYAIALQDVIDEEALKTSLMVTGPYRVMSATAAGAGIEKASQAGMISTSGAASRNALAGGRETIGSAIEGDPQASGWFRVTSGSPCAFCAMLAGRGPVYQSEETAAGDEYHDHCSCTAEPFFGSAGKSDWPARNQEYSQLYQDVAQGHEDQLQAFRRAYDKGATSYVPSAKEKAQAAVARKGLEKALKDAVAAKRQVAATQAAKKVAKEAQVAVKKPAVIKALTEQEQVAKAKAAAEKAYAKWDGMYKLDPTSSGVKAAYLEMVDSGQIYEKAAKQQLAEAKLKSEAKIKLMSKTSTKLEQLKKDMETASAKYTDAVVNNASAAKKSLLNQKLVDASKAYSQAVNDAKLAGLDTQAKLVQDVMQGKIKAKAGAFTDKTWIPPENPREIAKTWTAEERKAHLEYIQSGYRYMNGISRGTMTASNNAAWKKTIKDMDNVIAKYKIPEDSVYWRGVRIDATKSFDPRAFTVGDVYVEKGFTSMAWSKSFSENWAGGSTESVVFEIRVPKGTNYVRGNQHEKELVLGRNTHFKVIEVNRPPPGSHNQPSHITLEVVKAAA